MIKVTKKILLTTLLSTFSLQAYAQKTSTWSEKFYDPAAKKSAPADFVLPMPCGGQMTFQRVDVPLTQSSILADRKIRLGRSEGQTGYAEYLKFDYLRGAFVASESNGLQTYYYIGRYEMNVAQAKVLRNPNECKKAENKDRLVQTEISWFDAVDLANRYTEWLLENAKDSLPLNDVGLSFIRLPTETEWEYAARGGVAVDEHAFAAPRFPMEGELDDYAVFQSGSGNISRVGVSGSTLPNPLGIYDLYGNAEEFVHNLFQLNAVGREHGQIGGIITRGGSYLSERDGLYSAKRTEWPIYSTFSNKAQSQDSFGVRFVISSHISRSDEYIRNVQKEWTNRLEQGQPSSLQPLEELNGLIEAELDPARKNALESVQHAFRTAQARQREALLEILRAQIFAGAVSVMTIRDDVTSIANIQKTIAINKAIMEEYDDPNSDFYKSRQIALKRSESSIKKRNARLSASLLTYRRVLEQLVRPEFVRETPGIVEAFRLEMESTGESLFTLDDFLEDIDIFKSKPDRSRQELQQVAME